MQPKIISQNLTLATMSFLLTSTLIISAVNSPAMAALKSNSHFNCSFILNAASERVTFDKEIDFYNDRDFVTYLKTVSSNGRAQSQFDSELQTRIYSTPIIPTVSESSPQPFFIFIHGSGTAKSSGRNFFSQMNQLDSIGIASMSFDLPFHMDGPISDRFYDRDYFLSWMNKVIQKYAPKKSQIYFVGHSFGPDVILDYLIDYPQSATGILAMSPAGFNAVLNEWQEKKTDKMKFGGDVPESSLGGAWAAQMDPQFLWKQPSNNARDRLNSNLKITMLIGDSEEYVPGPTGGKNKTPIGKNTYDAKTAFLQLIPSADVVIEPDIGHYLFGHLDKNGNDTVLREMLRIIGIDVSDYKSLVKEFSSKKSSRITPSLELKYLMDSNKLFQSWAAHNVTLRQINSIIKNRNEKTAASILAKYILIYESRLKTIIEKIKMTQEWAPQFYNQNATAIAEQKENGRLLSAYADLLSKLSDEDLMRLGLIESRANTPK